MAATQPAQHDVTLLFAELADGARGARSPGEIGAQASRHQVLLRQAAERNGGRQVDAVGDSFFAAFASATQGVLAALAAQQALDREPRAADAPVRVGIGLHTGDPSVADGRYFGLDVHRAASIGAAASGGQILLSARARDQLDLAELPPGVTFRDLGSHRLKDLHYPEALFDVAAPGLADRFAPIRSLGQLRNNLPEQSTRVVGRAEQLKQLRALLLQDEARLVTVTGGEGTGKTRLALQVAADLVDSFPDGVFLVRLAEVSDPELVAPFVAHALGLADVPGRASREGLIHHLAGRRLLLLLDHVERTAAAGPLLSDLLAACAQLKLLVTSRLALGLRSERQLDLAPLPDQRASRLAVELLDSNEQRAFELASVFAADFAIESARAVGKLAGIEPERLGQRLRALVDHGLLVREIVQGEARLRMRVSLREYGRERLHASSELASLRAAHARHYLELAEALAPELLGRAQRPCVERLLVEADNLRAALSWALERPDVTTLARLIDALLWLWLPQGRLGEARVWIARALAHDASADRTRERASILDVAGRLSLFDADPASALGRCERALALFQQLGLESDVARAELTSGIARALLGRAREGGALIRDALERHRVLGDARGMALALIALGEAARARGDEKAAAACHEQALGLLRRVGDLYWPAVPLHDLAHIRLHEGDWRAAVSLLAELLFVGREYNHPMMINRYVAAMGGVAVLRGKTTDAARLFGAVSAALQQLGASFEPTDQQELERHMATTRSQLGDESFERAFAQGSHWSLDQAISATLPLRG